MSKLPSMFSLKRPCKHCPFRTDGTAIRFATRERAEEIEETAYRQGFPCHETAEVVHNDEDGCSEYHYGRESKECAGHIIMRLNEGGMAWPGIGNDEDLAADLSCHVDHSSPVFENSDDYLEANS